MKYGKLVVSLSKLLNGVDLQDGITVMSHSGSSSTAGCSHNPNVEYEFKYIYIYISFPVQNPR